VAAQAQQGVSADSTPEERAELQTTQMTELLALADSTQIAQIRAMCLTCSHKNEESSGATAGSSRSSDS
jgi:hypothetical protein